MRVLLALLFLLSLPVSASDFRINEVTVNCPPSERCGERRSRFLNLAGEYRSVVHLRDTLRIMASDGGYSSFHYQLVETGGTHHLTITFTLKPLITEIVTVFSGRKLEADPAAFYPFREGEAFEAQRLQEGVSEVQRKIEGLGYPSNRVSFEAIERDEGVRINAHVDLGPPRIFKSIRSNSGSTYVNEFLRNKFINLYNRPFAFNRFKQYLDDAQKELFSYGYYLIGLDFNPVVKGDRVTLDISVTNDKLFAFDYRNLQKEDRDVIHALVTDLFRKYKRPLTESVLRQALAEHYRNRGRMSFEMDLETSRFTNKYKESVSLYRLTFTESPKTKVRKIFFQGAVHFSQRRLLSLFRQDAFELASLGYYDEEYLNFFLEQLKTTYIKQGFVQVRIQGPLATFSRDKLEASVEYVIQEGPRAFVRDIRLTDIPPGLEAQALAEMRNKPGEAFNPIELVEDIKKITQLLQENGYYFAEISNANDDSAVAYNRSGTEADILLRVNPGPLVRLNRVLLLGNNKTRRKVIMKKVTLSENELITPSRTRDIEAALSATGLFNTVTVTPIRHSSRNAATDLVVKVTERDYGLIEMAPGFRTDLGIKLTGTISYMNIGGRNQAITLRGQVNQRVNFQTLDQTRRDRGVHLLEYNTSVTFTQGDIFDTLVDYNLGISSQRRRFYSFDADIQRINNTLTRDLTKRTSVSVRHQLENIAQFNATNAIDNGTFKIGAITPNLTYDLRNSQVNPTSGAFFNMSVEFANPYFLSQKTSELEINYYKLISRNRFYIPFKNGTIAISAVAGIQENLAREIVRNADGSPETIDELDENENVVNTVNRRRGYIPNIKVFRLTGMDIVRGYDDLEINRLPNDRDISRVRVQDRAYLANFKFEPRYFINDTLMGGVFFDAGRVFVEDPKLGDLRTSTGLTFKILTPVGTLDFDYGIKLLRKRMPNGRLEDPGRFHVSIGFF